MSLKFCNVSSTTQCTINNINAGTKSTFHHENDFKYTLTCWVHLRLPQTIIFFPELILSMQLIHTHPLRLQMKIPGINSDSAVENN